MQSVTVTFDEILHVRRVRANRSTPAYTVFSFMSQYKYTPYVTVPGMPRLEPGMKVKALLREANDWKSLIGWLDLETGNLVAPNPNRYFFGMIIITVWLAAFYAIFLPKPWRFELSETWLPALFSVAWAVFVTLDYKAWRRSLADVAALKELRGTNEA